MEQILQRVEHITGSPITALIWSFRCRLPGLGKTAMELAREGRPDEVLQLLDRLEYGDGA